MSDESPNELALKSLHGVRRFKKWPIYVGIGILTLLVVSLMYSIHSDTTPNVEKSHNVDTQDEKQLVPDEGGRGLVGAQQPAQTTPPSENKEDALSFTVVKSERDASPEYQRELEQLRRHKLQERISALASPLVIRRVAAAERSAAHASTAGAASTAMHGTPGSSRDGMGGQPQEGGGDYNPAADRDKEAFFSRARQGDREWMSANVRMDGQPLELKTGSVIPAVMLTGINSDLPGQIIAQVGQNVFDTANGKHLLIPQGSRLYGVYDSRVVFGQERVLVAWNRIIFPDGSALTLEAMPGSDISGFGGFNDEVNNHYLRTFGSAILMSLITGGMAWGVDSMTPNSSSNMMGVNGSPTMQQQMGTALASQLGQTTSQMLSKNMNIKPTLEIRPGYRFNIVVTKDLVFEAPYAHKR